MADADMIARLLARLGQWLYRLARKLDPDSPPWPRLPEVTYAQPGDASPHDREA